MGLNNIPSANKDTMAALSSHFACKKMLLGGFAFRSALNSLRDNFVFYFNLHICMIRTDIARNNFQGLELR